MLALRRVPTRTINHAHNAARDLIQDLVFGQMPSLIRSFQLSHYEPQDHFELGHGGGAHAPDEYYIIESANRKIQRLRWRDAVILSGAKNL